MPSFADPAVSTASRVPGWLRSAAQNTSLYPRLGEPYVHGIDDLLEAGDVFGGRRDSTVEPDVLLQVAESVPLYWGLRSGDLAGMADALAAVWRYLGVERNSTVALFEYSTAPVVAFASGAYLPHLGSGAAELVGCTAICNDGLPEMAERCVHLLRYTRPATLFVAAEAMGALIDAFGPATPRPKRVVVTQDDAVSSTEELRCWEDRLGAPVTQLWRSDSALLFAPACREIEGLFHPPPHYLVESLEAAHRPGLLCVTNLAVASSVVVRYASGLAGRVTPGACACGSPWPSVEIDDA